MNDAERSIQSCFMASAEFMQLVERHLSAGGDAAIRISTQIAIGRVVNNQVSATVDFKAADMDEHAKPAGELVKVSTKQVADVFNEWRNQVEDGVRMRRVGWLRLSVSVSAGEFKGGQSNPSWDIKPT